MEPSETTSGPSGPSPLRVWGFLCTALGALALGVGAIMPWATVTIGGSDVSKLQFSTKGVDIAEGKIALAAALVALIAVMVMRLAASPTARKVSAVVIIVAALVAAGFVVEALVRSDDRIAGFGTKAEAQKIADQSGLPVQPIIDRFAKYTDIGLSPGIYIALAGSVLVLIGGGLGLKWVGEDTSTASEPPGTTPGAAAPPEPGT